MMDQRGHNHQGKKDLENAFLQVIASLQKTENERNLIEIEQNISTLLSRDLDFLSEESKRKLFEILQVHLPSCKWIITQDDLLPCDIVRKSSQGRILRGTFLTTTNKTYEPACRCLIDVRSNVDVNMSFFSENEYDYFFSSKREYEEFKLKAEIEGYTSVRSENKIWPQRKDMSGTESNTFFAALSACQIYLAQWKPKETELKLSKSAMFHLKHIEQMLTVGNLREAAASCKKIFTTFGSHVFFGNVRFGGSYALQTIVQENVTDDSDGALDILKKNHTKAKTEMMYKNNSEKYANSNNTELIEDSAVESVDVKGGPSQIKIFPLWKRFILTKNCTWDVFLEGSTSFNQYIGIWYLVEHQSKSFENVERLSSFLEEQWFTLSGAKEDEVFQRNQNQLAEDVLQRTMDVTDVDLKCIETPEDCILFSMNACKCIRNIYGTFGSCNSWKNHVGTLEKISLFLLQLVLIDFSDQQIVLMLCNVKCLLQYLENDLSTLIKGQVLKWVTDNMWPKRNILKIKPTASVETWVSALGNSFLKACKLLQSEDISPKLELELQVKVSIEESIQNLIKQLINNKKYTEFLFLISLIIPEGFKIEDQSFIQIITVENIQRFTQNFEKRFQTYNIYRGKGELECQAAMIRTIILGFIEQTGNGDLGRVQFEDLSCLFHALIRDIKITPQINNLISKENDIYILLQKLSQLADITWVCFENKEEDDAEIGQDNETILDRVSDTCNSIPTAMSNLLEKLCLCEYFPEKITLQKVLQLRDETDLNASNAQNLIWMLMRKLLTLNSDFRDKFLCDILRKINIDESEKDNHQTSNDTSNVVKVRRNKMSGSPNDLHPQDALITLLQCFDPFLRKAVAEKMAICQLAIPLIYPNFLKGDLTFSLWPLREVFIEGMPESAASTCTKIVSFIRIGDSFKSKSKIINQFMRDQNEEHNTFFHRNCPLGLASRKLSGGVVEISWFSAGIDSEENIAEDGIGKFDSLNSLSQPLTILNLRGDASVFELQTEALLIMSSVVVLFIKYSDITNDKYTKLLSKIHKRKIRVIVLTDCSKESKEGETFTDVYKRLTNMNMSLTCILSLKDNGNDLNESDVKDYLTEYLLESISKCDEAISLEELACLLPKGIDVDEQSSVCMKGKLLSEEIFSKIDQDQSEMDTTLKRRSLPLQSEMLWQYWSNKKKEVRRSGQKENPEIIETCLNLMKIIRVNQTEYCNKSNEVMATFIDIFLRNIKDTKTINYLLSWLKQTMDCRSRRILPKLISELYNAFREHEKRKSEERHAQNGNYKEIEKDLEEAEKNLARASFGIEHFFRELGQIYEAFKHCKDDIGCKIHTISVIERLPCIAATALLLGHPLEILDGDAASVPLKWIKQVFIEVEKTIGEGKKLFSVSVLGIQSSGKSTLLNTMFGLQFAVSAGRCTRGIYIQIVKIDHNWSSLPFDYAMIIDTEGLRAPELSGEKLHHDNELATLVIGLGDIAIVNIKGEAIGDMADVIQIVVHAHLRLKRAKEASTEYEDKNIYNKRSCVFVHQCVSSQLAKKQMLQGNQKIVQNLDKMTRDVAEDEHMENIVAFQDVISFDPINHVKYIPNIWRGTPPLAPASPNYSTKVQDVTKCILDIAKNQKRHLSLSEIFVHLQSLWDGILSENFVFSFRNVLEVKAFNNLEKKYQFLAWKLEELKLRWIQNGIKPPLTKCKRILEIQQCAKDMMINFTQEMNNLTRSILVELEDFFQKAPLNEHMIHWKGRKLEEMRQVSASLALDIRRKIEAEMEKYKKIIQNKDQVTVMTQEINKKAMDYAKLFKGTQKMPNETDIENEFMNMWTDWLDDRAPQITKAEVDQEINQMEVEMTRMIYEKFHKDENEVTNGLKERPITEGESLQCLTDSFSLGDIKPNYIYHKGFVKYARAVGRKIGMSVENFINDAYNVVNEIFMNVDFLLKEILQSDSEYDKSQFSKILNFTLEKFNEHTREGKRHGFTIKANLQVIVVLHIARHSYRRFCEKIEFYLREYSLRAQMNQEMPDVQKLFVGLCTAKASEVIVTDIVCRELKVLIKDRVEREMAVIVPGKIITKFFHLKWNLIAKILQDLAEIDNNFSSFIRYIKCNEAYVLEWITSYTNSHFSKQKPCGSSEYIECISSYLAVVIQDIQNTTTEVAKKRPKNMIDWIDSFIELEKSKLMLLDPFKSAKGIIVSDFKGLSNKINEQLREVSEELTFVITH